MILNPLGGKGVLLNLSSDGDMPFCPKIGTYNPVNSGRFLAIIPQIKLKYGP